MGEVRNREELGFLRRVGRDDDFSHPISGIAIPLADELLEQNRFLSASSHLLHLVDRDFISDVLPMSENHARFGQLRFGRRIPGRAKGHLPLFDVKHVAYGFGDSAEGGIVVFPLAVNAGFREEGRTAADDIRHIEGGVSGCNGVKDAVHNLRIRQEALGFLVVGFVVPVDLSFIEESVAAPEFKLEL